MEEKVFKEQHKKILDMNGNIRRNLHMGYGKGKLLLLFFT
jgi:hypothetical protein